MIKLPPRLDLGFVSIVALIAMVAGWLLAMPLVPAVARSTMNRFHLCGDRFMMWAIQQPIPAMYNFANHYEIHVEYPAPWEVDATGGLTPDVGIQPLEFGYVNHFPTRMITFADARYRLLGNRQECWYELRSSYRDQSLTTRVHVRPGSHGGLQLNRVVLRSPVRVVRGSTP